MTLAPVRAAFRPRRREQFNRPLATANSVSAAGAKMHHRGLSFVTYKTPVSALNYVSCRARIDACNTFI